MTKTRHSLDNASTKSDMTLDCSDPALTIHPLTSKDGVIVKVNPPQEPAVSNLPHVPCDIVLVIDLSASMSSKAPAPMTDADGNHTLEDFGMSILDLTKHAAHTIMETLDENDRLGIVTFCTHVRVVQELLPMNASNKKFTRNNIAKMTHGGRTNLWQGIVSGLGLFKENTDTGRVPAVLVLTDGIPNHMCPPLGYVSKIRKMSPLPATIHTFGFGYDIRSGLLKSIAEIGGGNYAFIPDAGMIGTVFVHAVAHLQSTFATRCTLELTTPKSVNLRTTVGKTIKDEDESSRTHNKITIDLGNLQYGQSRDIYLQNIGAGGQKAIFDSAGDEAHVSARLTYSLMRSPSYVVLETRGLLDHSEPLDDAEVAYHRSRSMICDFLSSCFATNWKGEYDAPTINDVEPLDRALRELLSVIPAEGFGDPLNRSLMDDLVGGLPAGQVRLAVSDKVYFNKWGRHYYLSLWNAHAKQLCNSFKDPGPQLYNADSPLFVRCRDALDTAFDNLPPPEPYYTPTTVHVKNGRVESVREHNNRDAGCFAASSKIRLGDGREVLISELRKGASVETPRGNRYVAEVLKISTESILVCRVGNLLITPWHPIRFMNEITWKFPTDVAETTERYFDDVYSLLLEEDRIVDAHAVNVDGVWGVTLGHGLNRTCPDIRVHKFLGDYARVVESLDSLESDGDGIKLSKGVRRDSADGLICGFNGLGSEPADW